MTSAKNKLSSKDKNRSTRSSRSLFVIVVEGETEEKYFKQKWFRAANVTIKLEVGSHSDPQSLIDSAEDLINKLKEKGELRSGDQAWIVLDRDNNKKMHLEKLISWGEIRGDRYIGFSDPQFEYWLLLYYVLPRGIRSKSECLEKINEFTPNYRKNTQFSFTIDQILQAIENGEKRYTQMPRNLSFNEMITESNMSFTTLHVLTKNLLEATSVHPVCAKG